MPNETDLKVKIGAEDDTKSAFQSLGQSLFGLSAGASDLVTALIGVGSAAAIVAKAGTALVDWLGHSLDLAGQDEQAFIRLNDVVNSLGQSFADPELRAFEQYMVSLGQQTSDTEKSITTLARATGDVTSAISLSKLASDLAAQGTGTLESNTYALTQLMQGRFRSAAAAFSLDLRDGASAAELLTKIEALLKSNTEEMANTMVGQTNKAAVAWEEFSGRVGNALKPIKNWFSDTLGGAVQFLNIATGGTDKLAVSTKDLNAQVKDGLDLAAKEAQAKSDAAQQAQDAATMADKLKASFQDVSKATVSALQEQEKAIDGLRQSMTDLDRQLNDSIAKSEDKYQADVTNLARTAEDKVKTLDKQIADENASLSAGYRTRIADLQKQKDAELAIIAKAGGTVSDLTDRLNQDAFDQLKAQHDKDLAQIQMDAEKKKAAAENEITARTGKVGEIAGLVSGPGFFGQASRDSSTFLGSIGQGPVQQVLNFNFASSVAGDAAIKKMIQDTIARLNRESQLHAAGQ